MRFISLFIMLLVAPAFAHECTPTVDPCSPESICALGDKAAMLKKMRACYRRTVTKKIEVPVFVDREVVKEVPVPVEKIVEKRFVREVPTYRKNRIRAIGGVGPVDSTFIDNGQYVYLKQKYDIVFGLGYSRSLSSRISIGADVLTNKTFLLNLGYDFDF